MSTARIMWVKLKNYLNLKKMAMQTVGKFSLHNGGGFVAKMEFQYIDGNGSLVRTGSDDSILLGQTHTDDPGSLGVPDGSTLWLYVDVVWGTDNLANQGFIYQSGNSQTANYTITGTTLSNTLGLINVS